MTRRHAIATVFSLLFAALVSLLAATTPAVPKFIGWAALFLLIARVLVHACLRLLTSNGHAHWLIVRAWTYAYKTKMTRRAAQEVQRLLAYRFVVGVVAIVRDPTNRNAFLLAQHEYPVGREGNRWSLPGGAVEDFDSLYEALRRELRSEMHFEIAIGDLLVVDMSERPKLDLAFEVHIIGGQPAPSEEVRGAQFIAIDNLPDDIQARHVAILNEVHALGYSRQDAPVFLPRDKARARPDLLEGPWLRPVDLPFQEFKKQVIEPRTHTLTMLVDFTSVAPLPTGIRCPQCAQILTHGKSSHSFQWGDRERLQCIIHEVPVLQCECGATIPDGALIEINRSASKLRSVIEAAPSSVDSTLDTILSSNDRAKLLDFAHNRTRSATAHNLSN
jgi:8-oxo-dGTP diphosphatase